MGTIKKYKSSNLQDWQIKKYIKIGISIFIIICAVVCYLFG